MKKILLTAASMCALLNSGFVKAEPKSEYTINPYASIRMGLESKDVDGAQKATEMRSFSSRWGVKGSLKLSDELTVISRFEYGLDPTENNDVSSDKLRLGILGVKGGFGTVTMGSQVPTWHKFVRGAFFSDGADTLRLGTIRQSDLLSYMGKSGAVKFGGSLQFDSDNPDETIDTYQVGASYQIGDFTIKAALLEDNAGDNKGTLIGFRPEWKSGGTKIVGVYHSASKDFDALGANLCKDGGDTTTAGIYGSFKTSGTGSVHSRYMTKSCDTSGPEADSIKLEYRYFVDKRLRLWVSGEQLDKDAGADEVELQLGVRFDLG